MAERPELAAGTKERGDCHIDFLAVECITRSPPFSFLSLPSFFPLFTHRPTNPSIPRIFLLFPKGIRICIFKWNLVSRCVFFSLFLFCLDFSRGNIPYSVFRVARIYSKRPKDGGGMRALLRIGFRGSGTKHVNLG